MTGVIDVIDDDDAVRDSMRALLECFDYTVRDYQTAEDFLRKSDKNADCILVDQHMPGITGLALVERLRASGDQTPALLITGRTDTAIEPRAAEIDLTVLHKPIDDERLVASIEAIRRR